MTNGDPLHGEHHGISPSHAATHCGSPDQADLKAQFRAKGFVLTDEHHASARDWGRVMIVFYGSITLVLWGFAVFAFRHDDSAQTSAMSRWALYAKARHLTTGDSHINPDHVRNR